MRSSRLHPLRLGLPVLALALVGGCTASAEVDERAEALNPRQTALLERHLGGKTAGTPVNCITLADADQVIPVTDSMILYRVSSRLVYRNDLMPQCPGLGRDNDIILTRNLGSRLCDGDPIELVDRTAGFARTSCNLGQFTPYTAAN